MTRRLSPLFPLFAAGAVFCAAHSSDRPVHAVTCCHDFTVWKVSGDDVERVNPRLLRNLLRGSGYVHVLSVTGEPRVPPIRELVGATPDASRLLRPTDLTLAWSPAGAASDAAQGLLPGDVLIVGDVHSGVVNSLGRIDHYLQECSQAHTSRRADEVFTLPSSHVGPGGWTLERLLSRATLAAESAADGGSIASYTVTYPYLGVAVEVWRRGGGGASRRPTLTPRPAEPLARPQAPSSVAPETPPAPPPSGAEEEPSARRPRQAPDDSDMDPALDPAPDSADDTSGRKRPRGGEDEDLTDETGAGGKGDARGEARGRRPRKDDAAADELQEDTRNAQDDDRGRPDSEDEGQAQEGADDSAAHRDDPRDTRDAPPDNED